MAEDLYLYSYSLTEEDGEDLYQYFYSLTDEFGGGSILVLL